MKAIKNQKMKPFLLLQIRPEDAASDNEYEAFLKFSGLKPEQLIGVRIEKHGVPEINLDGYSGVLLGGGPFNVSDKAETKTPAQVHMEAGLFALLDEIVEQDFPFLGACYGVGILASHQGGTISKKYPEGVGPVTIQLAAAAQTDPLTPGLPQTFAAFGGHKEACEVLPKHAVLLASSIDSPIQMFRIKRNVYAVQFHTELDSAGLALRIKIYKDAGYFRPEDAQALIDEGNRTEVAVPEKILQQFIRLYTK